MSQKLPVGCGTDRTLPRMGVLGISWGLLVGLWDIQDTGTTAKVGVSQWDCGTDRTLGQLPRVGVLGMSQGLPIGLWDRQDTGTTAKGGSPRDSWWDCRTDS